VNVARWLQHLGGAPRLLLPLGGPTGKELAGCLRREALAAKVITVREPSRVNVIVTSAAQGQLRFNPKGPMLSATEWRAVSDAVSTELKRSSTLVLSGGLPPGAPGNAYAQLLRLACRAEVQSFLDCDGVALAAALQAKPFLVKPNDHELAQWYGKPFSLPAEIRAAARALSEATGGWVLLSRGEAGALLVHSEKRHELAASAPKANTINTVGAGDAMLAAVVRQVERQSTPEEWLRWGIAAGTAATECAAGKLPKLSVIQGLAQSVKVENLR